MLTNVATALFGLADMWTIGQLADAAAQGGVELGAKAMMASLNLFNFLRTGTVALTARATGADDPYARTQTLVRASTVALTIGAVLLCTMPWLVPVELAALGANNGTQLHYAATIYLSIRFWAAPVWLMNCVLTGWLIGQRRVRSVLLVEVLTNLTHIALDLLLVLVLHHGVAGVAFATFLSETLKFTLLALFAIRSPAMTDILSMLHHTLRDKATWSRDAIARLFSLNRDLFLRTLLLSGAILTFARVGTVQGPTMLAANGILFQLFMLASLILDGFESAAQVLCGEALGRQERLGFTRSLRAAMLWGGALGLVLSLAYALGSGRLIATFSTDPLVVAQALTYAPWLIAVPLAGFASFVLDGAFVGAGWTRAMLGTMGIAMALYTALLLGLADIGNNGLWLAFVVFLMVRAAGQLTMLPVLLRRTFPLPSR